MGSSNWYNGLSCGQAVKNQDSIGERCTLLLSIMPLLMCLTEIQECIWSTEISLFVGSPLHIIYSTADGGIQEYHEFAKHT